MIKAVMFDLDGTLLPTNDDEFTKFYFGLLFKKASGYGYEKDLFISTILKGVGAMRKNDGSKVNSELFWKTFASQYGQAEAEKMNPIFDEFYHIEFKQTKAICGDNVWAKKIVETCKELGLKTILSTSPFFPKQGVISRLEFVDLMESDFDYITHYDNTTFSKPQVEFFDEILKNMNLKPEEVLMFGNNEREDGVPTQMLGIKAFMVGDFVVSETDLDGQFEHLSFEEAIEKIKNLTKENV